MGFFTTAVSTMSTLVVALGGGVGVWGVINLMEGYGSDNPASNWLQLPRLFVDELPASGPGGFWQHADSC